MIVRCGGYPLFIFLLCSLYLAWQSQAENLISLFKEDSSLSSLRYQNISQQIHSRLGRSYQNHLQLKFPNAHAKIYQYALAVIQLEPHRKWSQAGVDRQLRRIFQSHLGFIFCESMNYSWHCIDTHHPFLPSVWSKFRLDQSWGLDDRSLIHHPIKLKLLTSQSRFLPELNKLIEGARREIALCAYTFRGLKSIETLLKSKIAQGVKVRVVLNQGEKIKLEGAEVTYENNSPEYHMHNKFIVVDENKLWTSTANFTKSAMKSNFQTNTVLIVQSRAIAAAYLAEFNEMFGVEGKYHLKKRPNTHRNFYFHPSGLKIRLYFAPTDDGEHRAIIPAILRAKKRIRISLFAHTSREIWLALRRAQQRGVEIKIMVDGGQARSKYSWGHFASSKNKGSAANPIEMLVEKRPGIHHDKSAVIDDAILITGSQNWTHLGNNRNDENLILLDFSEVYGQETHIIKQYQLYFDELWQELLEEGARLKQF